MDAVFSHIKSGGYLYISAPTGIGKTMAALFPAVKAMAEGHCRKLFYLTARNTVKTVAEDTLKTLIDRGFALRGVTLTAKDSLCPMPPGTPCHPEYCKRAAGFYGRLFIALDEVPPVGHLGRQEVEALADKYALCPHELSLSIAEISDVVICDYNNAFDPRTRIKRFFDKGGEYALLVDEAHNLVDRGRDMFSSALTEAQARVFLDGLPLFLPEGMTELSSAARVLLDKMGELGALLTEAGEENVQLPEVPKAIREAVEKFIGYTEPLLAYQYDESLGREFMDFYFMVTLFRDVTEEMDDRFRVLLRKTQNGLELHIRCIDPSGRLRETLRKIRGAIFYSATLMPFEYYSRLTGTGGEASFLKLPSPFPQENLKVIIQDIETIYTKRESTLEKLIEAVSALVRGKKGNYLVFFPSYRYMQNAHDLFLIRNATMFAPMQSPGMGEQDRAEFLRFFGAEHASGMVAFAVMGGIFGEGIDLVGEKVIGVAIVGVGIPQICLERNMIQQYHDERDEPGYDFSYTIPGFNRVLQAVGRLIRSDTDRGIVLLADRRFGRQQYQEMMPEWWQPVVLARGDRDVADAVKRFWDNG